MRHPGRRLLVIDVRGRERWLRRDKILDLSTSKVPTLSRQEALSHLRRIDEQRHARSLAVELQPLWEVTAEEGERRVWSLDELAELLFRSPRPDDRPVLLRALWEGRFFARHANGWSPLSREALARTGELESQKRQEEKELAEVAAWVRRVADGAAPDPRPANAEEAVRLLREAAVFGSGSRRRSQSAVLMERAHLHGPGAAFDVLVQLGFWDKDENLELHRCGVPLEFSPESLREADRVPAGGRQVRSDPSLAAALRLRGSGRSVCGCCRSGAAHDSGIPAAGVPAPGRSCGSGRQCPGQGRR